MLNILHELIQDLIWFFTDICKDILYLIKKHPFITLLITFLITSFIINICMHSTISDLKQELSSMTTKSDTITVFTTDTIHETHIDTIKINQVELKPVKSTIIRHDTIYCDTVRINKEKQDTLLKDSIQPVFIDLPIEQKYYKKDSIYDIWISGYHPELDSVHIYQKHDLTTVNNNQERTITNTIVKHKKTHFSLGPSVSLGYDPFNKKCVSSVGVSFNYSLFSW